MGLKEKILEDLKVAMKAQDADRLSAIRFLQAAVKNREIELRPQAITDQEVMAVVKKMAKQRKDSIAEFEKAGRMDLVEKERFELSVMENYLPQVMSREETEQLVDRVIKDLGATDIKQMGAVMKEAQSRSGGAADGKLLSELVKGRLA